MGSKKGETTCKRESFATRFTLSEIARHDCGKRSQRRLQLNSPSPKLQGMTSWGARPSPQGGGEGGGGQAAPLARWCKLLVTRPPPPQGGGPAGLGSYIYKTKTPKSQNPLATSYAILLLILFY